jgi:hypothetical protein
MSHPGGRPKIEFSDTQWKMLALLCKAQSTNEEVCAYFDIDLKTLNRLVKKKYKKYNSFSDFNDKKRKAGFSSIRAKQWQVAMNGNVSMLIWLGKNWLGQADSVEIGSKNNEPIKIEYCLVDENTITKTST